MEIHRIGHNDKSTTIHRSRPMNCSPVDVYYDDEARLIQICGSSDISGIVYLYDETGNIIGASSSLYEDIEMPVDYDGIITLKIIGSDWEAYGKIII